MSKSDFASAALWLAAFSVASIAIYDALFRTPSLARLEETVLYGSAAEELTGSRLRLGTDSAEAIVVEFVDFTCAASSRAAERLNAQLERWHPKVALVTRHFPLKHVDPHSVDAAIAVECSEEQGRYEAFRRSLFSNQDASGPEWWNLAASDADIEDQEAFSECMRDDDVRRRVIADMSLGHSIGVRGTPTFIFEGRAFEGLEGLAQLESQLGRVLGSQ